jgi:hypothetical protein
MDTKYKKVSWCEVAVGDVVFLDNYEGGLYPNADPKVSGPFVVIRIPAPSPTAGPRAGPSCSCTTPPTCSCGGKWSEQQRSWLHRRAGRGHLAQAQAPGPTPRGAGRLPILPRSAVAQGSRLQPPTPLRVPGVRPASATPQAPAERRCSAHHRPPTPALRGEDFHHDKGGR